MSDVPDKLAPLECHGVDFTKTSGDERIGTCPFCDKAAHFYANKATGLWHCKTCDESGNVQTFLTKWAEEVHKDTAPANWRKLAALRGLPAKAWSRWGVGFDGEFWLIPSRGSTGRVLDIRRWHPKQKKLYATTGCKVNLFGLDMLAKAPADAVVDLCEGEWDAMAMAWVLDEAGQKNHVVVGVPGAGTFKKEWVPFFRGRDVRIWYDNDDAGQKGSLKVGGSLQGVAKAVKYVRWPDDKPDGYDVRDAVVEGVRAKQPATETAKALTALLVDRHPQAGAVAAEAALPAESPIFADGEFKPANLADHLKAHFDPIRAVGGVLYHYDLAGIWREVPPDELGQVATELLGSEARTARTEDAIKVLAHKVRTVAAAFVPRPNYINLRNGMLNVVTGELEPHGPVFHSRTQLPFEYQPLDPCPRWEQFLREVFADEPGKARTLQQWFGYCLTPETFLQQFMILLGSGANGKGVALSVLEELVGPENRCAVPLDKLDDRFMLAQLKDKVVNIGGEIETSRRLRSSILKTLTGEDAITADRKYREPITFRPMTKHLFTANEMVHFSDQTAAMRRRVLLLRFDRKFEGKARDSRLRERLINELPGILNWALDGLRALLKTKQIHRTPSMEALATEFAEAQNPVLAFVKARCQLVKGDQHVRKTGFFSAYENWHLSNASDHPLSRRRVYERLLADFPTVRSVRVHGYDCFKGIVVAKEPAASWGNRGKR
ncbi:MAG: phage/plasmid primase, P4 family [Planctomycetota bacterium]|nr:phage/plasmid primase, P4 family [Planctomycetota bacterium]